MAEIYRAKTFGAAGFEKEFAIKLILPSLVDDTEFVEMFINEAKIAVSLYHANIVQVFDLGEMDDQYYIAMEFVHGKDLLDVLARCAEMNIKIPLEMVLFIAMEMLKGLDFAHRAKDPYGDDLNIIHRDVSPSNILISYAGDVKVGDFGVAKAAVQRTLTESGTLKGKVGYMSPEQVMGDEIDSRSDLFSACIVLFEALSMNRLFVGNSDLDVMLKVRDADYAEGLKKAGPMPSDLVEIIDRGLAKHREDRFQTAGEFYQALVDFCFQHSIKVTGSDLSNFMRRLFAPEIEEEKSLRRSEPSGEALSREMAQRAKEERKSEPPMAAMPPTNQLMGHAGGGEDQSGGQDTQRLDTPQRAAVLSRAKKGVPDSAVMDTRGTGEGVQADRDAAQEGRYRFRDKSGMVFGPMGQRTLVDLLRMRRPRKEDRISVEEGPWKSLDEISELEVDLEVSERPQRKSPAETAEMQEKVGAGILRGAAEGGHSAGLADSSTELAPPPAMAEASSEGSDDKDVGDASSPVAQSAPSAVNETGSLVGDTIQELKEQYASYQGDLQEVSFARILARLHLAGETGRLHVHNGDVEKSIYFREGEPIFVDSNLKEELLGNYLRSRDLITKAQLKEALQRLSEWGGRLGDALVAIGAIPAHDIFDHLSAQMEEKLLEIFGWEDGEYGYFEGQEPETQGYPLGLNTYQTIVEGCRTRISIDRIRAEYANRSFVSIYNNDPPPFDPDRLGLRGRELRVLNELNSGETIEQLRGKFEPEQHEQVYRTLYLLHQVELLSFEVTKKVDLPPLPIR